MEEDDDDDELFLTTDSCVVSALLYLDSISDIFCILCLDLWNVKLMHDGRQISINILNA